MEDRLARLELVIDRIEHLPAESRDIVGLLQDWGLGRQPQECLWAVAYDAGGAVRTVFEVNRGAHAQLHVDIPSILSSVLMTGSRCFTIAHNHPVIDAAVSQQDVDLTHEVMAAANACGLIFEDHIVVWPTGHYFSFADAGLLEPAPRPIGRPARSKAASNARRKK